MTGTEKDVLTRFGVSMPDELVKQFDQYITEQGYTNRSEAIRDLVRRVLLEPSALQGAQTVAGTIVMVYDHHMTDLPLYLMELQHDYHHDIISTMHVHLNHDQCMEVIVVRGVLSRLRELHQRIQVQKGVLYAELSVTYADAGGGGHPSEAHGHTHARGSSSGQRF
ncbi:nickel-responsive transcriptional regulator NikR [Paenibacillus mucilaginosus]|uniref:Putative nickel-responsive regulator n=3 Tax=Paenibacillus mucilaginosus TaxID=61624 RepID=H6NP84_9BACL|nr:nickel-responsive transcriptional regulator NikR [Paenibacillus mucilaginosus]AEI44248.1 putative transcriptional regulator, CopG family [Paenibacillus mucilaginosus KNP414]AFC31794.1 putative CopG family transcriptional regulator [Paenibacillus mucilaginosus 3016]AFH64148.1 NAD+ synthetase [Paenibacillus mucilaginosus K02]MCG7216658.1 nickel-responsive transcriptional regulator NikR [Paenibacillus mucilaginosus]WDM25652.1 nickel-responsive transcriptional regulator NikR [Paenibacillus muci